MATIRRYPVPMQEYKQLYSSLFSKQFSDQTWYRLMKSLRNSGITESDYPTAFKLLAKMNRNREKLIVFDTNFLDTCQKVKDLQAAMQGKSFTCEAFVKLLFKEMRAKPKHDQTWYRWFSYAGLNFKAAKVYPIDDLLSVAANAFIWLEKVKIKMYKTDLKQLEQSIIDVEII